MDIPILRDVVIIFAISITVIFLFSVIRVPTILGFLLTGILAGPHVLGLIEAVDEVEVLAEIGVVMLLFTIGIDFSLEGLLRLKRVALIGGFLQVFLTSLTSFFLMKILGRPLGESVFTGFLISLSSTAIVIKLIQERAEVESPHGGAALGILIFQDIAIIPIMLITPILAGNSEEVGLTLLMLLVKGMTIVILVIIAAKWVIPWLLFQITRSRSSELFLLGIVVICLAVAWFTSSLGLSLAIGAFLAGLIISESEYSQEALSKVLPFRDIFASFFFVSIGMLLDVKFLLQHPFLIILITLAVLVLKIITSSLSAILVGFPLRSAILVGLALCQIGEFSFILSESGVNHGLLNENMYQIFLSVAILTMAATPFILMKGSNFSEFVSRLPLPNWLKSGLYPVVITNEVISEEILKDHLIIIGFGVNGKNITRAAKAANIPYVIIEMNPETVREEKLKGEFIFYGDATQEEVLKRSRIANARVLVIAISDAAATRRITSIANDINPKLHIIARTRFVREVKPLYDLGADEVIPEEYETSIEIFARVLMKYLVPRDEIEEFIAEVRSDGYEMFRNLSKQSAFLSDLRLHLSDMEISSLEVNRNSTLIGKTLAQVGLRNIYGVTVLAIRRNTQLIPNPAGDERFSPKDQVIILGSPEKIVDVASLFRGV
jgi:CPA2 family monovalent cation:H+ antiporter-2